MKKFLLLVMLGVSLVLSGCSTISILSKDKLGQKDYILPSDTQVITEVDLSKLNETEIEYAYEEIFARHGKIYTDANYERYFTSKAWYYPDPSFNESALTDLESENARFISSYIISHKAGKTPEETVNTEKYNVGIDTSYIIPDSSTRRLTKKELSGYSKATLALIRNEIYARNGYIFSKQEYRDYFASKAWYHPDPKFNESLLSDIEVYNIKLIKSME